MSIFAENWFRSARHPLVYSFWNSSPFLQAGDSAPDTCRISRVVFLEHEPVLFVRNVTRITDPAGQFALIPSRPGSQIQPV